MTVLITRPVGGSHATPATEPLATPDAGAASGELTSREELARLLPAIQQHPELDLKTLRYHLEQSDATADDGYWHAAINEARSFLEALVVSIAQVERRESLVAFRKGKESQGGIRLCRRFLVDVGFLDANEDDLLQHVYSIASAKGSHQGVTDAAWSRLARRIVLTTGQYLLRRYAAWKHNGRPVTPVPAIYSVLVVS